MTAFSVSLPLSGAIHFQGMSGSLVAIDSSGSRLAIDLDAASATRSNRLSVQCKAGRFGLDQGSIKSAYENARFFLTAAASGGDWIVTTKGVYTSAGKRVKDPRQDAVFTLAFEIRGTAQPDDKSVWLGWMASDAGRVRVSASVNGKEARKQDVLVESQSEQSVEDFAERGFWTAETHIGQRRGVIKARVGDIIAFPFSLNQLKEARRLALDAKY